MLVSLLLISVFACVSASSRTTCTSIFTRTSTSCTTAFSACTSTLILTSHSFTFHCLCNHRIAQQSHCSDNRQSFPCGFFKKLPSVLSFIVFAVFHCCFAKVITHYGSSGLIKSLRRKNTPTSLRVNGLRVNRIYVSVKTIDLYNKALSSSLFR